MYYYLMFSFSLFFFPSFCFQALGAGKLDDDENQLIQAPEGEEDFDILNDETFGDVGDGDYVLFMSSGAKFCLIEVQQD